MNSSVEFLTFIKKQFPAEDGKNLITALHHERSLWDWLTQADVYQSYHSCFGSALKTWSPARLGVFAAYLEDNPDIVDPAIVQKKYAEVLKKFELMTGSISSSLKKQDVATATKIAYLIRYQFESEKNFQFLSFLSLRTSPQNGSELPRIWRLIFAILDGIYADADGVYQSIFKNMPTRTAISLIVHAILSQPSKADATYNRFHTIVSGLPGELMQAVIQELNANQQHELADRLTETLVSEPKTGGMVGSYPLEEIPVEQLSGFVATQYQYMRSLMLKKRLPLVEPALVDIRKKLDYLINTIEIQLMLNQPEKSRYALPIPLRDDTSKLLLWDMVVLSKQKSELFAIAKKYPELSQHLLYWIKMVSLNMQANDEDGIRNSLEQCRILTGSKASQVLPICLSSAAALEPILIEVMGQLDATSQYELLMNIGEQLLSAELLPSQLVEKLCEIACNHEYSDWVDYFGQWLLITQPENVDIRRTLGKYAARNQQWASASDLFKEVMNISPVARHDDWALLAASAYHSKDYESVIDAAQHMLSTNANDITAHLMLAETYHERRNYEKAMIHYNQALETDSGLADAWLGIARLYADLGKHEQVEGVLNKGLASIPESLELHTAFGEYYFDRKDYQKAEDHLYFVIRQNPANIDAAALYLQILWDKQAVDQYERLLEEHRTIWDGSPVIGYYLAKLYLFQHEFEKAIPYLWNCIHNGTYDLEKIKLLINSIVRITGNLLFVAVENLGDYREKLNYAVELGLQISPEDFEIGYYYSQLAMLSSDWSKARQKLDSLAKYYEAGLPVWKWQILASVGKVALAEGQVNVAMAALQTAQQANPDEIKIIVWLAEATIKAQLEPQALLIAEQVYKRAQADSQLMCWYIDFIHLCGESSQARKKLDSLIQQYPQQSEYRFKALAYAAESGNSDEMHTHMEALLNAQQLNEKDMRKLANFYVSEGKNQTAQEILRRSLAVEGNSSTSIKVELYRIAMLEKSYEEGYQLLDGLTVDSLFITVLKIDALIFGGKYQTALEQLLQITEQAGIWSKQTTLLNGNASELAFGLAEDEYKFVISPTGVYLRLALVYRLLGNLPNAISSAEKALAFSRESAIARYYVVMLMKIGMDVKRLSQVGKVFRLWQDSPVRNSMNPTPLEIRCTEAISLLELESHLDIESKTVWEHGKHKLESLNSNSQRASMLEARLRSLQGEIINELPLVTEDLMKTETGFTCENGFYSVFSMIESDDLWYCDGFYQCKWWEAAWKSVDTYYQQHQGDSWAIQNLLTLGSRLLEQEILLRSIKVENHLPSAELSMESVMKTMQHAMRNVNDDDLMDDVHIRAKWLLSAFSGDGSDISINGQVLTQPVILAYLTARLKTDILIPSEQVYINSNMEDRRLLLLLALTHHDDDPEKGLHYAKRALGIVPKDPISRVVYAKLAERNGDHQGALHAIEAALVVWEDEWQWRRWAAANARLLKDEYAFLKHTEMLHAQYPEDAILTLDLAEAFIEIQSYEKAIEILNKSSDFALEVYGTRVHSLYVAAYYQAGQYGEALKHLAGLSCENGETVNAHIIGAKIKYAQGIYDQALIYAQAAYTYHPGNPENLLILAKILLAEGHEQDALSMLRQIEIDADPNILSEQLVMIRRLSGDDEYQQDLDQAMTRYQDHPGLLYLKAVENYEKQHHKEAVQLIKQALRIDSTHPDYHELAGKLHRDLGQLDQAVYHFSAAIEAKPASADLYLTLAKVHVMRRELSKALDVYRNGIQNAAEDFRLFYEAALLMRENKKYQDAEVMFRRALALQPANEDIRHQLGAVMALNFVHNPQETRR